MVRYPDAHQLFVGNVPHDVDKNELKEFFERELGCVKLLFFLLFVGVKSDCFYRVFQSTGRSWSSGSTAEGSFQTLALWCLTTLSPSRRFSVTG